MTSPIVGFVGLGSIGLPMARNIAEAGYPLHGFDVAEPSRWSEPPIIAVNSITEVADVADIIFLSLPDAKVVESAVKEIAASQGCRVQTIVDLSTVGSIAAKEFALLAAVAGIDYVDAPVSGGVAGARDRKISIMCACRRETFATIEPVLKALSDKIFHVGEQPGQGQAVKILNNFLSASALVSTSEAVLFGMAHGLRIDTLCEVVGVSSGRNSAIDDKFPNHVAKGKYDSGFRNSLMAKDLGLYLSEVESAGTPAEAGRLVVDTWRAFAAQQPDEDFTRLFEFVREGGGAR